jgi:hypothetical protein
MTAPLDDIPRLRFSTDALPERKYPLRESPADVRSSTFGKQPSGTRHVRGQWPMS